MAANLQSFQSNDKQMQAIRELTNEVFNLKQKQAIDEALIETNATNIQAVSDSILIIENRSIALSQTVEAGNTKLLGFTATPPTGYNLYSFFVRFFSPSGLSTVIPFQFSINSGSEGSATYNAYNYGSADVPLTTVWLTLIFKKTTA